MNVHEKILSYMLHSYCAHPILRSTHFIYFFFTRSVRIIPAYTQIQTSIRVDFRDVKICICSRKFQKRSTATRSNFLFSVFVAESGYIQFGDNFLRNVLPPSHHWHGTRKNPQQRSQTGHPATWRFWLGGDAKSGDYWNYNRNIKPNSRKQQRCYFVSTLLSVFQCSMTVRLQCIVFFNIFSVVLILSDSQAHSSNGSFARQNYAINQGIQ